ncbi:HupE/UreJ family protein [bacterium]|nr:HupE/UreJ family protein [bacterium]
MKKNLSLIALFILFIQFLPAHGISEADKASMLSADYLQYIGLGASHMLTGYDHLLFLFGVIFFLKSFKDIVWFISAFTLGHSITLIFATFMGISANYYLIDAVIALTVIYKGFDNINGFQKYLQMKAPNITQLVFVFGLIHGFGLSTRLQQLNLGEDGLLLKIVSFNLGVEFGQITALTFMLFLLAAWRKSLSFQRFTFLTNVLLMILGSLLFLMQMHGYSHQVLEIEKPAIVQRIDLSKTSSNAKWLDTVVISIKAKSSLEYKFHLNKGETLNFNWFSEAGPLFYDFHADPDGDTSGYFESFQKMSSKYSNGTQKAPFNGAHGWYFKNNNAFDVKVTLQTSGNYKILGIR